MIQSRKSGIRNNSNQDKKRIFKNRILNQIMVKATLQEVISKIKTGERSSSIKPLLTCTFKYFRKPSLKLFL